jgi:hypothetical protein
MASTCDACGYRSSEVYADFISVTPNPSFKTVIIFVLHHAVESGWGICKKRKKDDSSCEKC